MAVKRGRRVPAGLEQVLAAGGDAGRLMTEIDWASTPVGPMEAWPQSLRSAVSICLLSRFPMVVWWGPELVFIYNDAYRPVLGNKDPREIMGRVGREVWPEIWPIIGPMLDGVMTRREATWSTDQLLYLERSGYAEECYFTFSYSPISDESGGVGGVFTAVTETTERVLGERRLRTLSDLAETTATARDADEAGRLAIEAMARNPADIPLAAVYLAAEAGAEPRLVAATGFAAAAPADPALLAADDTRLVLPIGTAGMPAGGEVMLVGINPHHALDDNYRSFFELVAGQVATAVADARAYDAERKRAEALAELDRAKTAFFSNVSHEFRTPLTLLLGPLEDALEDQRRALEGEQRERVTVAHRNALRLLRLVNTLLDFARLEAGRVEARYAPADLSVVTAELASSFRSAVERAGLRLIVDCPPLPEPVFVDREMWEKVVLNLLSNALKFTFEGEIRVTTAIRGGRFELEVADTGSGIPEAELGHLFERFHRIRGARARTHEGTGIGLALANELVLLHRGSIAVRSEVGTGTAFTVSLPLGTAHLPPDRLVDAAAEPIPTLGAAPYVEEALRWLPEAGSGVLEADGQPLEISPPDAGAAGSTAGARVLVADDNADMREYLERLLAPHWRVETFGDGAAALAAIRRDPPDLVLTDVMMPGLDGFELIREVRGDPRLRHLPVVVLSARAGQEATVEGLEMGANDYLVKPFVARELVARVRANLEAARMRLEVEEARIRAEESGRALERALKTMNAIAGHIRAGVDLRGFYGRLSATVADIVGARMVIFWRSEGDLLHAQPDAFGVPDGVIDRLVVPASRTGADLGGRVVFEDEVVNRSLADTPDLAPYREAIGLLAVGEVVAVPWRLADLPLGILAVYDATKPGGFTSDDESVLRIAALAAALVWEHKRAEDELDRMRERETQELRQAAGRSAELERIKSEFLRVASHELRGPLAVIRGYLSMAREGSLGAVAPEFERILPVLVGKVAEMNMLVEQMLDTARLEDQRLALTVVEADLRDVVSDAVDRMRSMHTSHSISVHCGESPVPVSIDRPRLETVLTNLIDNAVKYSPAGSAVAVECDVSEDRTEAVVRVTDHGIGIAAEDLPRLFARFGRIVTPENSHIPGTGLGLYLAEQLVRMHGGEVRVESAPGVGSTFTVALPLALASPPSTPSAKAPVGA